MLVKNNCLYKLIELDFMLCFFHQKIQIKSWKSTYLWMLHKNLIVWVPPDVKQSLLVQTFGINEDFEDIFKFFATTTAMLGDTVFKLLIFFPVWDKFIVWLGMKCTLVVPAILFSMKLFDNVWVGFESGSYLGGGLFGLKPTLKYP